MFAPDTIATRRPVTSDPPPTSAAVAAAPAPSATRCSNSTRPATAAARSASLTVTMRSTSRRTKWKVIVSGSRFRQVRPRCWARRRFPRFCRRAGWPAAHSTRRARRRQVAARGDALATVATPLIRPPPPIGTISVSRPGASSKISSASCRRRRSRPRRCTVRRTRLRSPARTPSPALGVVVVRPSARSIRAVPSIAESFCRGRICRREDDQWQVKIWAGRGERAAMIAGGAVTADGRGAAVQAARSRHCTRPGLEGIRIEPTRASAPRARPSARQPERSDERRSPHVRRNAPARATASSVGSDVRGLDARVIVRCPVVRTGKAKS